MAGIDVVGIVDKLMIGERKQLNKLNVDEAAQEIKLSLYGQFKSVIESFKQNVDKIKQAFETIAYNISSSNEAFVKAEITSNSNVYAGKQDIVVSQLAQAESRAAVNTFSSKSSALNLSGDLIFTVDGNNFTVSASSSDTLADIRDRINTSDENNGVVANIMATTNNLGDDEYTLIISSKKTGVDNAVSVSGSLASTFDFSDELSVAKNAEFTFNGRNVVRDSNTISDVIDGISFSLLGVGSASITIAENSLNQNADIKKSIQDMVSSYNQILDFLDKNVNNKSLPDSTVPMIKSQLRALIDQTLPGSGAIKSLIDIGVKSSVVTANAASSTNSTASSFGRFEVDTTLLDKVLAENKEDVRAFLLNTDNFIPVTSDKLDEIVNFTGPISQRTLNIKENITRLNNQIGLEESRLDKVQEDLLKKYAALSALMDKYDQMSGYLTMTFNNTSAKK